MATQNVGKPTRMLTETEANRMALFFIQIPVAPSRRASGQHHKVHSRRARKECLHHHGIA